MIAAFRCSQFLFNCLSRSSLMYLETVAMKSTWIVFVRKVHASSYGGHEVFMVNWLSNPCRALKGFVPWTPSKHKEAHSLALGSVYQTFSFSGGWRSKIFCVKNKSLLVSRVHETRRIANSTAYRDQKSQYRTTHKCANGETICTTSKNKTFNAKTW